MSSAKISSKTERAAVVQLPAPAETGTSSGGGGGGSGQAPAIRTFQLDGSAIGNLSSSVNLFRGDVNLTQTLFTLPGRAQDDGLDVNLAIQYQSNIERQATLWNRDAATGVVGLGWTFPLSYIEAVSQGSPVRATQQYICSDNGSANPLTRQPQAPQLFRMDAYLASGLRDGQPIPPDVLDQFLAHGLAPDATATVRGNGPWTIDDSIRQQLFDLKADDGGLLAFDGGESYQLENYQFLKVLYYPPYERWVVITDDANSRSFGGVRPNTSEGFRTSAGNSVAWGVWWTDGTGAPAWTGPSTITRGQVQVARAWYLESVTDRFGSRVSYLYNTRQSGTGLLPGVEQRVGADGLPYTKAVYLSGITDVFGRQVQLSYADKLWESDPESPREYADPYRETPSDAPGPYQERYETQYLDRIQVLTTAGDTLFTIELAYAPRPSLSGPERAVANVTANTGALKGDTFKRFLTGLTMYDQDGVPQPGMQFGYFLDDSSSNAPPGAMATVTYPEGGVAAYTYTRQDLDICDRCLVVPHPPRVEQGASPRVFFGPDYAVVSYYNANSLQLSLQVFTWSGSWLSWQLDDDAILDEHGLDLETLEVMANQEFLALTFERTSSNERAVYVLQRDDARPGRWGPATIAGVTTARNTPNLKYSTDSAQVEMVGGDTFFLVSRADVSGESFQCELMTWRWTTAAWTQDPITTSGHKTWVTARREYYAVLAADSTDGTLVVHYLDGALAWQETPAVRVSGLITDDLRNVALVPGDSVVVVSNLQSDNQQQNTYQFWAASWSASYVVTVEQFDPFTDYFDSNNAPTGWVPQVISNTLIASNGNLLRYDGSTWQRNTNLNPGVPPAARAQRYAFGPDYAARIVVPTGGVGQAEGKVLAFDPTQDCGRWSRTPTKPKQPLSDQTSLTQNWPTSGGPDYTVVGPYVYFRGTDSNWQNVVERDALVDLDTPNPSPVAAPSYTFDSESLINEAPGFLAYSVTDPDSKQEVKALLFQNGRATADPQPFTDEKMYTVGEGSLPGRGLSPEGPQIFVTYPSDAINFDSAPRIFLHRYANSAVTGPITHYAVTGLTISDGFQDPHATSYEPDQTSAGCDPSGQVVKYYRSTTYPGTADPASPAFGSVANFYLNGLNDLTGDNDYNMLDGLLLRTETRDSTGNLLESSASTWSVFKQVASGPSSAGSSAVRLHGGWVARTSQTTMKDGVTTTSSSNYQPANMPGSFNGQPVSSTTSSYGGTGTLESFTQTTRYGVEIDEGLWAIHALSDPAQVTTVWSNALSQTVPTQAVATTYTSWPSALDQEVSVSAPEASFGLLDAQHIAFPYDQYSPGSQPAGWQLVARTTQRAPYGQERESVNALGIFASTFFSLKYEFAVFRVVNAPVAGAAYLSFQSYEDVSQWTLDGVRFDDNDAFLGTRSAVLPGGSGASVSVTVEPGTAGERYLVGSRYKTPPGFTSSSAARWTATVVVDGVESPPVQVPFEDTGGQWAYRTFPVPIPESASADPMVEVRVEASNASGSDIHLNALAVTPLVNGLTARTFDEPTGQITSTSDSSGRTSRTYYDRAGQPTLSVGASGTVRELAQRCLSRRGSPNGAFQPASPNAEATLHPAGGGRLETFRDGGSWQGRWTASHLADHWSEGDGALTHTSSDLDTLTWAGDAAGSTFAVYFELQTTGQPNVSIGVGDVQVGFLGGHYSGRQGANTWTPLTDCPVLARHWLLVVGEGVVLFLADGQLLFSQQTSPAGATVVIGIGNDKATFRNLSLVTDVRLGVSYNDAAGRQRQAQQLHGADSLVVEQVYDALDRQVATTRTAPGRFGSGANQPVLQYRPGFLNVANFLGDLYGSWQMSGDIADYYRGQPDGPVHRSDDQGYPYRGTRFESSPRSQQVEQSLPGKADCIDLRVPPNLRQTTQFLYGANSTGEPPLPPGQYYQNTLISPVKSRSLQVTDQRGQQISTRFEGSDGSLLSRSAGTRAYSTGTQGPSASLTTQLPNATTSGPQSDPGAYKQLTVSDALQQTIAATDPDSGETQFVYDVTGQLRFVRPQPDAGTSRFIYYKYDSLGRQIEEGSVAQPWDRVALKKEANDPPWPTPGATPAVTYSYDGDGTVPSLIGKKHISVAFNPAPEGSKAGDCTVTETFDYDTGGHLTSVGMRVRGPVDADATVSYHYNNLGEVLEIELPQDAPMSRVCYSYDDQGRVVSVGTADDVADLGSYTWTPEGTIQTELLGNGRWNRATAYDSAGRVLSMTTASDDRAQYLALGYYYEADGAVQGRTIETVFGGINEKRSETFTYDGQRRLSGASGATPVSIASYDPNGNIWSIERDGTTSSFPCAPGSDWVATAQVGGGLPSPVAYNSRGQLISGFGRNLTYDFCTGTTTTIASDADSIRLAYGGAQQRVVKQKIDGSGDVVYLFGAGRTPVARRDGDSWSVLVQGPSGLLAVQSDRRLFPLKDTAQTTWAVVDSEKLVAQYAYLPFGELVPIEGGDAAVLPYLFQGQEWDSEVGLYNFRTRMYDPVFCRFLTPDPARQFASPYVFEGNSPLSVTDPTGEISIWAQVGIGAAMVLVTAAGLALTFFTAGASDAAAAGADVALAGGLAAAEGVTEGVVAGAEGAAVGASEVVAGASSAGAAAGLSAGAATSTGASLATFGVNVTGSTLLGGGISGLQYDIQHGRDFTAKGFFEAAGIGAASGFVGGVFSGAGSFAGDAIASQISAGVGKMAFQVGSKMAVSYASSVVSSDVSAALTNVAQHHPFYQGLLKTTLNSATSLSTIGSTAFAGVAKAWKVGVVSDEVTSQVKTLVDRVKTAATSQDAYAVYGTAAFFVVSGYVIWGAADNWGRGQ